MLISETDDTQYAGKSLVERVTGKFYTPDFLGCKLANSIVDELDSQPQKLRYSICDPFGGDGRLITALLNKLYERGYEESQFLIIVKDIDQEALNLASQSIFATAKALGLNVSVETEVGDSFYSEDRKFYDVVVTNPPWELLKPDRREMAHLSDSEAIAYKRWLKERCLKLHELYPEAKGLRHWGGWGTNLARCGWALSIRNCKPSGILGIVLPGTIFADQTSQPVRQKAFEKGQLCSVATFPAEARLFERVDQPVVLATFRMNKEPSLKADMEVFNRDKSVASSHKFASGSEEHKARGYTIPVTFGFNSGDILPLFDGLPTFKSLEGEGSQQLWAGRELDETRVAQKLCESGTNLFVKGRHITRHTPSKDTEFSVLPEFVPEKPSIRCHRVVWRDVARSSQARRMIVGIIPPNWVAGNSLHVAFFRDDDVCRLKALYAILSSYVFEFQVRTRLSTGHMSLGVVREGRLPDLTPSLVDKLATVTSKVISDKTQHAEYEVTVAKSYGLSREIFAEIIDAFPKLDSNERNELLNPQLWATKL